MARTDASDRSPHLSVYDLLLPGALERGANFYSWSTWADYYVVNFTQVIALQRGATCDIPDSLRGLNSFHCIAWICCSCNDFNIIEPAVSRDRMAMTTCCNYCGDQKTVLRPKQRESWYEREIREANQKVP